MSEPRIPFRDIWPADISIRALAALGRAWRRCEAALPEGWRPIEVRADDDDWTLWNVNTASPAFFNGETDADDECESAENRTLTDALNALADALESRTE